MLRLFDRPCLQHLYQRCPYTSARCQYKHKLPTAELVHQRLEALAATGGAGHPAITEAYQFVHGLPTLFEQYFSVFCALFGRLQMRGQLESMAGHCERQPQLLCHVVYALTACGAAPGEAPLTPTQAVRLVLSCSDGRNGTNGTANGLLDVHVQLMLHTTGAGGAVEFMPELGAIIDRVKGYRFQAAAMCELVEVAIECKSKPLILMIFRILSGDPELGCRVPYERWAIFSGMCKELHVLG